MPHAARFWPASPAPWQAPSCQAAAIGRPVCEHFAPLAVVQRLVTDYVRAHGHAAEEKVLWRNAKRVYGWIERAG